MWTGSEVIIWGGFHFDNQLNTGGRYNPITDSWTPTSTTNAKRWGIAPMLYYSRTSRYYPTWRSGIGPSVRCRRQVGGRPMKKDRNFHLKPVFRRSGSTWEAAFHEVPIRS